MAFKFLRPSKLTAGALSLKLESTELGDKDKGYVPSYHFNMILNANVVGKIRLRIGTERELLKVGNIGYEVNEDSRGQGLAGKSCKLLLPLAAKHGLKAVWFTIKPNNIASQKTVIKIGAIRVETILLSARNYRRRYKLSLLGS